jgi:hypothetical protein
MKLRYFSFAIMVINMLIMFSLLIFTYSIAKDMQYITNMIIEQNEGYYNESRILPGSFTETE